MANENTKVKTKDEEMKKFSRMQMLRRILPLIGLVVVFLLFNTLTNGRMGFVN